MKRQHWAKMRREGTSGRGKSILLHFPISNHLSLFYGKVIRSISEEGIKEAASPSPVRGQLTWAASLSFPTKHQLPFKSPLKLFGGEHFRIPIHCQLLLFHMYKTSTWWQSTMKFKQSFLTPCCPGTLRTHTHTHTYTHTHLLTLGDHLDTVSLCPLRCLC